MIMHTQPTGKLGLWKIWIYWRESSEGLQRQLRYWSTCHTRRG